MAVGMIEKCDTCGESWDSGRVLYHRCNPKKIAQKEERERWPQMTVEEKCEWLKARIEEVNRSIPYDGGY